MPDTPDGQVRLGVLESKMDEIIKKLDAQAERDEKRSDDYEKRLREHAGKIAENKNEIIAIKTKQGYINWAQIAWSSVASALAAVFGGQG